MSVKYARLHSRTGKGVTQYLAELEVFFIIFKALLISNIITRVKGRLLTS